MKKSFLVLVLIFLSVLVKAQNSNGTILNDDQLNSLLSKVGIIVLVASVVSFLVWLFKKEKS